MSSFVTSTIKKRAVFSLLILAAVIGTAAGFLLQGFFSAAPTGMWVAPSDENNIPARIDVFVTGKTEGGRDSARTFTGQLYLPGNADPAALFLSWDGEMQAMVNGRTYASGACPVPALNTETVYTLRSCGRTAAVYRITAYQGSRSVLPVFIEINESRGTIAAMDGDSNHEISCAGRICISGKWILMPRIKGRGNYTWMKSVDKCAYNVTLGKKISIPGLDSAKTKKWTLLSEIGDHSLLRNRTGFWLAHRLGVGQDTASADVWMNGEYQGCYTITPKYDAFVPDDGFLVEEDNYKEAIPVGEGGDPQFELDGLSGLVGLAQYSNNSDWNVITVKKMGKTLLAKYDVLNEGDPEKMEAAADEIRIWLQQAWDAVRSDDGYNAETGKYHTEYIDIESFAKMYLMLEYAKSYDVCAGSIFFHRDGQKDEDRLIAGPLWDLDNAMGSVQKNTRMETGTSIDRRSGKGAFLTEINTDTEGYKTSVFRTLYDKHQDFRDEVVRQYNRYRAAFDELEAVAGRFMSDDGAHAEDSIAASARMNHIKVVDITDYNLHQCSRRTVLEEDDAVYRQVMLATADSASDWDCYAANLKTFIHARSLWFRSCYPDEDRGSGPEVAPDTKDAA